MDTNEQGLVQVAAAPLAAPSAAVAGLVAASIADNTKRTYAAALKRLDAALEGQDLTDASLAVYLASLHAAELSPAVASMAVASVKFRCRLQGLASPVGPATDRVLAGLRREGKGRGRGQVDGVRFSEVDTAAAVAANDSGSVAGLRDAALLAVASDGLLRVSEIAALDVGDVQAEADGSGRLLVGESKTDQEGQGAAFEGAATSKAIQGAGCQSTPSAESSAAGRPLSASRAGYPVTVSELVARNRWQPAGPRLSRCRRRAGGSRRRCRATMHEASWQHGAPWPASATVADKATSLLGVGVSTLPLETAGQGETKGLYWEFIQKLEGAHGPRARGFRNFQMSTVRHLANIRPLSLPAPRPFGIGTRILPGSCHSTTDPGETPTRGGV